MSASREVCENVEAFCFGEEIIIQRIVTYARSGYMCLDPRAEKHLNLNVDNTFLKVKGYQGCTIAISEVMRAKESIVIRFMQEGYDDSAAIAVVSQWCDELGEHEKANVLREKMQGSVWSSS